MFKTRLVSILAGVALAALAGTAAQAQIKERNIRVSNGINEDHPVGNGVAKMKACMADKSGGKLKLQAFWGGALGGDLQATQALRAGTQEMVITSSSPLVGIMPELGVFDLPFLFSNEKEADTVLDGAFGKYISDKLPGFGVVNLSYWENGFRNLTNSKRAVSKADELTGLKVRVMQNNIFLDSFKSMGTNATPMAFGEVFAALETHAIDGQENPLVTIDTSKLYEVQKYLTMTRHAYTPFLALYSKKLWDQLSAEEQTILTDCSIVGRDEERRVSRELNDKSFENLKKQGMQVSEVAPAELTKMREATAAVYQRHEATIGKETIERLKADLAKIRGTN
ncbi:TRAP transporter substrate-binding protein [Bosea caraganae]|uniref:TRAP transporter substrate-binding protein n=1 Tax=Bosea caraganae TaxID=2763117 RepID=A0A370L6X5_9HYPH|nr:TRAP transporter substrate-binding protein [Bosea caraganae]RDJ25486.1 TRAP transporter substrate-binding protein [Bosea caraganae]RDJ25728.1 TRAP transporter substrate-binding protein [Bosea caraganae]